MSSTAHTVLRGLQVFFGIIVLGLSANLVATQAIGGAPSATNYNVFLGLWIVVIAAVGFAAGFTSMISDLIMTGLDALSVLFTFAGGAAYAAQLGVHSCACNDANSSCPYLVNNNIINGGMNPKGEVDLPTNRVRRCQSAQADTAFIWFAFACSVGTLFISVMTWRRDGKF